MIASFHTAFLFQCLEVDAFVTELLDLITSIVE